MQWFSHKTATPKTPQSHGTTTRICVNAAEHAQPHRAPRPLMPGTAGTTGRTPPTPHSLPRPLRGMPYGTHRQLPYILCNLALPRLHMTRNHCSYCEKQQYGALANLCQSKHRLELTGSWGCPLVFTRPPSTTAHAATPAAAITTMLHSSSTDLPSPSIYKPSYSAPR